MSFWRLITFAIVLIIAHLEPNVVLGGHHAEKLLHVSPLQIPGREGYYKEAPSKFDKYEACGLRMGHKNSKQEIWTFLQALCWYKLLQFFQRNRGISGDKVHDIETHNK